MEYFDIRKMPVSLWRNGAGETREICCFPPATRDFHWRASIASIAGNGEFSLFPGIERVITLLEGSEVTLESQGAFSHTLKQHQPFTFAGERVVKARLTEGQMSMDFNIMTGVTPARQKCGWPIVPLPRLAHAAAWCLLLAVPGNWAISS